MNIKNIEQQLLDAIKKSNFNDFKNDVIFFLKNIGESAPLTKLLLDNYLSFQTKYLQPENKILTSVIIPCHNYGLYLRDAVISVLHQTFPYFEIIIINDGSEDNSHSVATKILSDFPDHHISYINQPHSGIVQPRNRGVGMARGKYILPLDADDMIAPQFLEKTVAYLDSHPSHGYVSTKALFFGDVNKIWPRVNFHPINLFVTNQQTNTTLYRKEMWENIGGYDECMIHGYMDWEFWIRATKFGWTGHQIDEPLFFYRRKSDSVVMKAKKNDVDIKIQIMKLHPEVYNSSLVHPDDSRLSRKNLIHPDFLRPEYKHEKEKTISNNYKNKHQDHSNKALFICHNFPPHSTGGAQKYAFELAKKLNQNAVITHAVYPEFSNNEKNLRITSYNFEELQVHKLHKETTYGFSQSVRHEGVFKVFDNFLSTHKFDIIHIHSLGQLSASPIEVAKKHSKTVVLTLHDLWFLCFFWFMTTPDQKRCTGPDSPEKCARCFIKYFHVPNKSEFSFEEVVDFFRFRKEYFKKMFDIADYKFAPSQYLIDEYKRFGYNGITLSPLGFEHITSSEKTNSKNIRFGYIGNISVRKGVNLLIDAFEYVHKIFPNTQLNIHGNSSEPVFLDYVTKRVATHPAMHYSGKYTPQDLSRIFSDIDILIVPSLWENFPLVVQESFQHKTPVIASNIAGFPEMIQNGQTGLLFNVGDTQDLAEKLLFVCSKPEMITKFQKNISPVRSIQDDVNLYISVYNKGTCTDNTSSNSSTSITPEKFKILFFFFKNVHIPILLPLYHALKAQNTDVDIAFSYLPPAPEIRAGLFPDEVRIIEQAGAAIYATPQEFRPDLTFIADSVYSWVEGCGKLVHVGHGVLSKGQYYTDTPTARREELADLVCVPGKHHQGIMRRIISKPVVATGMCKLDDLFSGKINRASVIKQFGLPEDYRYVLFAPTFNDELSAIPFVKDRIGDVLPGDKTLLIVKLHASTKPEYKEMYRTLPGRDKRVIYADELDITPFLALCDVMISDVSSAMMEFAALDKPVILFNNPNWTSYQNYNPADIEFQWRDIGVQVAGLDEMREAVALCLQDPDLHADKRKKYTDLLFANKRDGNAAQRIVKIALSLVQTEQER